MTRQRRYGPDELVARAFDYDRDLGDPGTAPFTRGIDGDLYGDQPW
ncbi:MAG: hypothetical protein QOE61_4404, partial [Micromonosporaceae bacterium]|nr:hypothetical protein [Micromonosporaceae bacterium]